MWQQSKARNAFLYDLRLELLEPVEWALELLEEGLSRLRLCPEEVEEERGRLARLGPWFRGVREAGTRW